MVYKLLKCVTSIFLSFYFILFTLNFIACSKITPTHYCWLTNVNVRYKPGLKEKAFRMLNEKEEVEYLSEQSDFTTEIVLRNQKYNLSWWKIEMKDGKTGWVYSAVLKPIKTKCKVAPNAEEFAGSTLTPDNRRTGSVKTGNFKPKFRVPLIASNYSITNIKRVYEKGHPDNEEGGAVSFKTIVFYDTDKKLTAVTNNAISAYLKNNIIMIYDFIIRLNGMRPDDSYAKTREEKIKLYNEELLKNYQYEYKICSLSKDIFMIDFISYTLYPYGHNVGCLMIIEVNKINTLKNFLLAACA